MGWCRPRGVGPRRLYHEPTGTARDVISLRRATRLLRRLTSSWHQVAKEEDVVNGQPSARRLSPTYRIVECDGSLSRVHSMHAEVESDPLTYCTLEHAAQLTSPSRRSTSSPWTTISPPEVLFHSASSIRRDVASISSTTMKDSSARAIHLQLVVDIRSLDLVHPVPPRLAPL